MSDLYDPRTQWASFILNALKVRKPDLNHLDPDYHVLVPPPASSHQAKELQVKNVGYIVKAGEIIIVDEFTGRTMPGRRWSDGLHQVG